MYLLTAQGMSAVRRQATEIIMKELIQILEGLERDSLNMVLTVVGPELTGEKCLLADGKLLWESEQGGFFAEHLTEIRFDLIKCLNKQFFGYFINISNHL